MQIIIFFEFTLLKISSSLSIFEKKLNFFLIAKDELGEPPHNKLNWNPCFLKIGNKIFEAWLPEPIKDISDWKFFGVSASSLEKLYTVLLIFSFSSW